MEKFDRDIVIEATFKLCQQMGFCKLNVEDVARASRLSRATLYNHFKNKSEIVSEMLWSKLGPALEEYEAVLNSGKGLAAKIDYAATAQEKFFTEFGEQFLGDLQNASGPIQETVDAISIEANRITINFLRRCQKSGLVRRDVKPEVFQILLQNLAQLATDEGLKQVFTDERKRSKFLLSCFMNGLAGK